MAKKTAKADTGANIGFEGKLWQAADALRNNMDAAEYKHVVLGLIFLKIPKSTQQPERILQAINRPGRDTAERFVMSWIDTRDARVTGSKAYAILNDAEQSVSPTVLEALRSYDVRPSPWSERDNVREELAA